MDRFIEVICLINNKNIFSKGAGQAAQFLIIGKVICPSCQKYHDGQNPQDGLSPSRGPSLNRIAMPCDDTGIIDYPRTAATRWVSQASALDVANARAQSFCTASLGIGIDGIWQG